MKVETWAKFPMHQGCREYSQNKGTNNQGRVLTRSYQRVCDGHQNEG